MRLTRTFKSVTSFAKAKAAPLLSAGGLGVKAL